MAAEPNLPAEFTDLTVTRVFRGATYRIAMKRTGERSVSVNGERINGNVVPPVAGSDVVEVEVTF